MGQVTLKFFLDQNVPDPLGKMLKGYGHEVVFLRKHLQTDAKDNVVAAVSIEQNAILVTADRDFKGMAKAAGVTRKQVHLLHRALIRCPDPDAHDRFEEALRLIEFEWLRLRKGKALHIEVGAKFIKTHR